MAWLICGSAPLEESRKWGIYNIINLLFKTYFKLNSISLSKNILQAIQAYRGDMPALSAFPMAHQVTFKYYAGVIYFLAEAYQDVSPQHIPKYCCQDADPTPLRQKNTSQKHSNYVTKMPSATKSESTTNCLTWSHISSFKTNKSQVNSHLPHPLPPPDHTHTSHPRPPLTLPSAPNPIPSPVPLYQKGRPIRL
jgi:hypothetical protein